jgi:predicted ABC-type ATPase
VTAGPQFWVFAGPNGAGKSTIVARYRVPDRIPVVNPDTIAARLQPGHKGGPAIMLRAGRIAASERRKLMESGRSFAIETTLTGHSELRMMACARAVGYKITLVYVGLNNALTSLARVRGRVARGGHDVPTETVLRRYGKSLENLPATTSISSLLATRDSDRPG